jgi:hypothetical protein
MTFWKRIYYKLFVQPRIHQEAVRGASLGTKSLAILVIHEGSK